MTENDFILLLQLYSHRHLNEDEIIAQLSITKSQLIYRISKINQWLKRNDLDGIHRSAKHIYFNEPLAAYIETLDFSSLPISHLDQEARLVLIFVIIAISEESLSLEHLSQYVSVSKNTILMDIKIIKSDMKDFDVKLDYSRTMGYRLKGDEFDVRRFAEYYITLIPSTHVIVNELVSVEPRISILIDNYQNLMFHAENELKIRFSDRVIENTPLYFYLIDQRIAKKKAINEIKAFANVNLENFAEYQLLNRIAAIYFYSPIKQNELYFLTLYLLSVNKSESTGSFYSIESTALTDAIAEFLDLFEKISALGLKDRKDLVEKLTVHLSAAFYRYKYAIRSPYPIEISERMRLDLEEIYFFISQSIFPIETMLGLDLPDEERFFIASYIGGHIRANRNEIQYLEDNLRAIVICENGIVYSNILMNNLKQMFQEIEFLAVYSIREFKELQSTMDHVDIVFSSKYISTDHNLVVVNSFDLEQESRIIKEVNEIMRMKGHYTHDVVNDVMALIPNEISLEVRVKMKNELRKYFGTDDVLNHHNEDVELTLLDVLEVSDILFYENEKSWTEILQELSEVLVVENQINAETPNLMMKQYPNPAQEILFGGTILFPHIRVEGLQGFCIKLAVLNVPIQVNGIKVHLVLMLIAGDGDSHVKSVYQVHQISMSEAIKQIEKQTNPEEIVALMQNTLEEKA